MKKKLTTWALCLTAAISPLMFTGCSSDITFNQKDLDETINNINEYLETQNNYSSEFAKNSLNGYLIKALDVAQNETNLRIDQTSYGTDCFGHTTTGSGISYKYFSTNDITKEFLSSGNDKYYYAETVKKVDLYERTKYSYDGALKTKHIDTNRFVYPLEETDKIGFSNTKGALAWLSFMLGYNDDGSGKNKIDEIIYTDFIMSKDGDNTTFKVFGCNPNYQPGPTLYSLYSSFEIKFNKFNLVEIGGVTVFFKNNDYYGNGEGQNVKITFTRNISDFTFDKEGYVEN